MTTIISHDDLDGIACQTLKAKNHPEAERIFLGYLDLGEWLKQLQKVCQKPSGERVYVADLGLNRSFRENGLLRLFQEIDGKHDLVWYDHHLWKPEDYGLRKKETWVIDKTAKSAAGIVAKAENLNDNFSQMLVKYADLSDNGREDQPVVVLLEELICSGYDKDKIVRSLALERLWPNEFNQAWEKYCLERDSALEFLARRTNFYSKKSISVVSGLASPIIFTKPARKMLMEQFPLAGMYLLLFEGTTSATLYSQKVNVGEIALALGGGGHEYSAGFQTEESITPDNRKKIEEKVLSLI